MGKVLRFILILISILIVGFLVLCAVTDSEVNLERRTTINASKAVVWEQVVHFKNWEHWNAWKEQDTTITVTYNGTDGEQGSSYTYHGNIGEGTCTNMGVTDGEMKYAMDFIKPFPGKADGYYKVVEEAGKTTVIMTYHSKMGFLGRGMFAILGKGMLEKTFDRSLELLKQYCEAHAAEVPAGAGMTVTAIQFPAHIYAGIKGHVSMSDAAGMHNFFSNSYTLLGKEAGARIIGPAAGLILSWSDSTMSGDMIAAFPVGDNKPVKGAAITEVAASPAYQLHYVGPYSRFGEAHGAVKKAVADAGKTMKLRIEEYIKTPGDTPDSTKWETNIIYLVN